MEALTFIILILAVVAIIYISTNYCLGCKRCEIIYSKGDKSAKIVTTIPECTDGFESTLLDKLIERINESEAPK